MANIKVSEMTEATIFDDGDYVMIVQGNQNKKISKENMLANVGDISNLETTDKSSIVNSINEVNDMAISNAKDNIYSLNETDTGKIWIDGKPIYRKVIDFGTLPNQSTKLVSINVNNFDKLITLNGLAYNSTENNYFPLPTVSSGGAEYMIDLAFISSEIRIRTLTDRSNMTAYIIIEYTKATD